MFEIKVPATSANLGCGFDTLGIAYEMYNSFTFTPASTFKVGEGFAGKYRGENNLVMSSLKKTLKILKKTIPGVVIDTQSDIPVARGLGSSATCIIAGVLAAYLLSDTELDMKRAFHICADFEKHADNVSAALFGGLTLSYKNHSGWQYLKYDIHPDFGFLVYVPDFRLSTAKARGALPESLSYGACVNNIARSALMLSALTMPRADVLRDAVEDKLHQPYRIPLIKEYNRISAYAYAQGAYAVCISGAGPSILTIVKKADIPLKVNKFEEDRFKFRNEWRLYPLKVNEKGVKIIEGDPR
jgi:homoserine kinase